MVSQVLIVATSTPEKKTPTDSNEENPKIHNIESTVSMPSSWKSKPIKCYARRGSHFEYWNSLFSSLYMVHFRFLCVRWLQARERVNALAQTHTHTHINTRAHPTIIELPWQGKQQCYAIAIHILMYVIYSRVEAICLWNFPIRREEKKK